jgi:tetratricopeptide (TPR) repeat protein
MIDKAGNAKIMDFGIARSLEGQGVTQEGAIVGTPIYMSPEQVDGKPVDRRTDIYSLGIILYEMATGKVPFDGETSLSIAYKHKNELPREPKKLDAQISDSLNRLILVCLEKEKNKRFQSAEEVLDDLVKIEKGFPTKERKITHPKFTISVRRSIIPIAALALLAVIVLFIWQPFSKPTAIASSSGKPRIAVLYLENVAGDEELETLRRTIPDLLFTDLFDSQLIEVIGMSKIYGILKELELEDAPKFSSRDLQKIAEKARVNHIAYGSLMKSGEKTILNYKFHDVPTDRVANSRRFELGEFEEVLETVDKIAVQIKKDLDFSPENIAQDTDNPIGDITSRSMDAQRFMAEARKYHNNGDFREAARYNEKAIAVDPEFAQAYVALAWNKFLGGERGFRENLQKAYELRDRLPSLERLLIEAQRFAGDDTTRLRAIEIYENILENDPENGAAHFGLGAQYIFTEDIDKSIFHNEVLRKRNTQSAQALSNLAWAYQMAGKYDKAAEVYLEYLEDHPDNKMHSLELAGNYRLQGKFDLAVEAFQKWIALDPTNENSAAAGFFHQFQGDFKKAESNFMNIID